MNQDLTFVRANSTDLPAIMEVINSRVRWLDAQGSRQWNSRDFTQDMEQAISSNSTWLLQAGNSPVGVINLTTVADPDFWTAEEQAQPALYIGRMATHLETRGQGLGELLLDLAQVYAERHFLPRVRWDAWRGNQRLHRYYKTLGSEHIRTAEVPHRDSGDLFEIAYKTSPTLTRGVSFIDPLTTTEVPSRLITPYPYDDDTGTGFRARVPDSHYHEVAGVGLNSVESPERLTVPNIDAAAKCIYFSGDAWRLHDFDNYTISSWSGLPKLHEGHPYAFKHVTQESGDCGVQLVGSHLETD